jgi:Protein of unknown function (DUF5663)
MIKLDQELLAELGLGGLLPQARRALLEQMYSDLELRVGSALASLMTDAELE